MKLLIAVECNSEWWEDAPTYFFGEIGKDEIARIKELAEIVKKADVYQIEEFDGTGDYYDLSVCEFVSDKTPADSVKRLDDCIPTRTSCNTLKVQKNSFKFSAFPKDGCGEFELNTIDIPLTVFDNYNDEQILMGEFPC